MIVICDALCQDFVHEEANAGVVNEIFNNEKQDAIILSDKKHYQNLSYIIKQRTEYKQTILFKKLLVPSKLLRKINFDKYLDPYNVKKILSFCKKNAIKQIVFLSITGRQLDTLNKELDKKNKIDVLIILHGIVSELEQNNKTSLFKKSYINSHKNIKFVLLSPHIEHNLNKMGFNNGKCFTIDHPYVWNKTIKKSYSHSPLKICAIGYIHNEKGRVYIERLINQLADTSGDFQFHILGSLEYSVKDSRVKIFNRRFTREELDKLVPKYDYILVPYSFDGYSLKVSGIFFDAINYNTPIITFKNTFTKYYFNKLGNIGYMLDSEEGMNNLIMKLIMDKREDEIKIMIENLEKAKDKLSFSFLKLLDH